MASYHKTSKIYLYLTKSLYRHRSLQEGHTLISVFVQVIQAYGIMQEDTSTRFTLCLALIFD